MGNDNFDDIEPRDVEGVRGGYVLLGLQATEYSPITAIFLTSNSQGTA